jgi:hypothetical protein
VGKRKDGDAVSGVDEVQCGWSGIENGADMPEPSQEELQGLINLIGFGSAEYDDRSFKLAREAYRQGWEVAQRSHDEWRA